MNDFTKEELESIWRWADAHSDKEWYKNLSKKIRPMIDNYCDHEGRFCNDIHSTKECIKCEERKKGEINENHPKKTLAYLHAHE